MSPSQAVELTLQFLSACCPELRALPICLLGAPAPKEPVAQVARDLLPMPLPLGDVSCRIRSSRAGKRGRSKTAVDAQLHSLVLGINYLWCPLVEGAPGRNPTAAVATPAQQEVLKYLRSAVVDFVAHSQQTVDMM